MKFSELFGDAVWIGADEAVPFPLFRRVFSVDKPVCRASIRILGFGTFLFFINGVRGTDALYLPLNSNFEERDFPAGEHLAHRTYVCEYEITHLLRQGTNALAVLLGDGWYNGNYSDKPYGDRKLCYTLTVCYEDGTEATVVSSQKDQYRPSFLTHSNFVKREDHDYSLWSDALLSPDFDDGSWQSAHAAKPLDTDYQYTDCPPDRVTARLVPTLVKTDAEYTVWDAGKNIAGFPVLHSVTDAPIRVTFYEELLPDGTSDPKHHYGQEFRVTGAKSGQTFYPQFTWFGFRYMKIEGAAIPTEICVAHSDVAVSSSFESDDETLNWIYQTYLNTQLCNMHGGIPSDCPHIERRGYTGDGQITCRSAMKALDARAFYRKWIADISDCQNRDDGHVQYTAPYTHSGGGPGGWGCAIVVLPYEYMKHYGDDSIARAMYPQMLRYFEYLESHSEGGFITTDRAGEWCLGDWCTPDPILLPPPFVNNYFYIVSMRRVIEMARLFGHEADIPLLERRIEERLDAIRVAYFDRNLHSFFAGLQGADAFGLDLGLGDEKTREKWIKRYETLGYYDTGIFGTDVVTRLLFENGRGDLACRLLTADTPHGFGRWKKEGATSFREYWGTARSHSHPMFGSVICYLFEYILGIRQEADSYGYRKVLIAPCGAVSATGHLTTPHGEIRVSYEKKSTGDALRVTIPAHVEATIRLPSGRSATAMGPATIALSDAPLS